MHENLFIIYFFISFYTLNDSRLSFMKNFHENFGDFHQHFHTQNRKTNGRKTPEMFNFGNIFSVSDNDNRSLIYTSIVTFTYIFI